MHSFLPSLLFPPPTFFYLMQYKFESENPYQEHGDPFNEGLQKRAEGDLPSAILLFESALQKDPDHIAAWEALGELYTMALALLLIIREACLCIVHTYYYVLNSLTAPFLTCIIQA